MQGAFSGNRWCNEPYIHYVCIPTCAHLEALQYNSAVNPFFKNLDTLKISPLFYGLHCPYFQCIWTSFIFSFKFSSFCPLSFYSHGFCLSNPRTIQALTYIQISALRQMSKPDNLSWCAISKIPKWCWLICETREQSRGYPHAPKLSSETKNVRNEEM